MKCAILDQSAVRMLAYMTGEVAVMDGSVPDATRRGVFLEEKPGEGYPYSWQAKPETSPLCQLAQAYFYVTRSTGCSTS